MQDPSRRPARPFPPTPHRIFTRPALRAAPETESGAAACDAPERAPGIRLREIHLGQSNPSCVACAQEFTAPGSEYRVVLRCTTAERDH